MKAELAAEPGSPACVEPGVEVAPGSMESARPAGRQKGAWPVLVAGRQPWLLVTRLQLLLRTPPLTLPLAAPASRQRTHLHVNLSGCEMSLMLICRSVPVSVEPQPDLNCFVAG